MNVRFLAMICGFAAIACAPLTVFGASLTGVVVAGEEPVARADVQLIGEDGHILAEVRADAEGRFKVETPQQGGWLQARTEGRVSAPMQVGREAESVTVRLGGGLHAAPPSDYDRKIESIQQRLASLQAELTGLISERAGAAPESEVLLASLGEPPALAAALPQNQKTDSLYPSAAGQTAPSSGPSAQRPASLPGRSFGNKGLNQGLAAGAPGSRYGRSIHSDFLRIGGYGSFCYETNNLDLGPQVGDLPRLKRSHSGFDFRRFVFTMDAAPHKRLRFYTEVEFERLNEIEIERTAIPENRGRATRNRPGVRFIQEVEGQSGGEIAIEQAWMQYNFTDSFASRVGVILPPVGRYNILHDDDY